jgi:hypothetical protein
MTARNLFSLGRSRTSLGLAKFGLPKFCACVKGVARNESPIIAATAIATAPTMAVPLTYSPDAGDKLSINLMFAFFTGISFPLIIDLLRGDYVHGILNLL